MTGNDTGNRRGRAAALLAFALAFVLSRAVFLAYSPYVYDEEESKTGAMALIFLNGPKLPALDYIPGGYEGGNLVAGWIAMPGIAATRAFWNVHYLGLKATEVLLALALALLSIAWTRRLAGDAGAVAAAALWLFCVPFVLRQSLILLGNYTICAVLALAVFLLLHRIVFDGRRAWWRFVAIGLLFGVGTWMHYGFLTAVAAAALVWLLADARQLLSLRFGATVVSAVAGLAPWFVFNARHHWLGLARFREAGSGDSFVSWAGSTVSDLAALLAVHLPQSFGLIVGGRASTIAAAYLYYALAAAMIAAGMLSVASRRRDDSSRPGLALVVPLVYAAVYAAAFAATAYQTRPMTWMTRDAEDFMKLFPLLPPLITFVAVAAGRLFDFRPRAAAAGIALMAALGLAGQAGMLRPSEPQYGRLAGWFSTEPVYLELGINYGRSGEGYADIVSRLDASEREWFRWGYGHGCAMDTSPATRNGLDRCLALSGETRWLCLVGLGSGWVSLNTVPVEVLDDYLAPLDPSAQCLVRTGGAIGAGWEFRWDHPWWRYAKQRGFGCGSLTPAGGSVDAFLRQQIDALSYIPPKE